MELIVPGLKYGPHGYSAYPWRNGGQQGPVLLLLARTYLSISMILVFNNAYSASSYELLQARPSRSSCHLMAGSKQRTSKDDMNAYSSDKRGGPSGHGCMHRQRLQRRI